jgi:hypothetical protein
VRLAEVKETRVRSKNLHQRALANLSTLLGFGPHVQLSLLENENLHTEYPDTYDKGIKIALTNRSEIKENLSLIVTYDNQEVSSM